MTLIPPPDSLDPVVSRLLGSVQQRRGGYGLLHRQMAHLPPLVEAFEALSDVIRQELPIGFDLFGLIVLRTVQLNQDPYQWPVCVKIARDRGMSDTVIDALPDWRASGLFTERQKAALSIVDETMTAPPGRPRATAEAQAVLTPAEIVSVCAVIGWFRLIGALTIPLDLSTPEFAGDTTPGQ